MTRAATRRCACSRPPRSSATVSPSGWARDPRAAAIDRRRNRLRADPHERPRGVYIAALDELCARTARFLVGRFGEATDG